MDKILIPIDIESILKMLDAQRVTHEALYELVTLLNETLKEQDHKQPVKMELDYDQKLCCTLHATKLEDLDFTFSNIKNKITDSYPSSFHFNGSGKTDGCREPILKHLNLI